MEESKKHVDIMKFAVEYISKSAIDKGLESPDHIPHYIDRVYKEAMELLTKEPYYSKSIDEITEEKRKAAIKSINRDLETYERIHDKNKQGGFLSSLLRNK